MNIFSAKQARDFGRPKSPAQAGRPDERPGPALFTRNNNLSVEQRNDRQARTLSVATNRGSVASSKAPLSLLATLLLALSALALASASAFAAAPIPYKYEKVLSERLSTSLTESVPTGFLQPWGLSFDATGNLFVTDTGEGAVEGAVDKFDQTNAFVAPRLGPGVLTGHLVRNAAVSDATGHLYVADSNHDEVIVLGAAGEALSQWTGANTPAGSFGVMSCCVIYDTVDNSTSASRGDVYVMTNQAGGEVDVLEPQGEDEEEGKFVRKLEAPTGFSFGEEDGLAVNDSSGPEAGEVYVADTRNKVVDRFSASGVYEAAHQITGPSGESFQEPVAVAVDPATGDVFVADRKAKAIDYFSPEGTFIGKLTETEAGEGFAEALGVAVQPAGTHAGDVYVSDLNKKRVDVFAPLVPELPVVVEDGVTQVTADSASLTALIKPRGETTEYRFEYGACPTALTCASSNYERSVPSPEGRVGAEEDFGAHEVSVHVQGLSAGPTYHFRIVAHNNRGEAEEGQESVFTTQGAGGELVLPDGRQWELVSPPDKHGGTLDGIPETGVVEASSSGDAVTYLANAPTEADPGGNALSPQVLSTRTSTGWGTRDIAISHQHETGGSGNEEQRFFSEDLDISAVQPIGPFEPELSEEASEQTAYLQTLGGCESSCFQPLVTGEPGHENVSPGTHFGEELFCLPGKLHAQAQCGPYFLDATSDLSHVVLESQAPLETDVPRGELYEWFAGQLQLISVLPPNGEARELPAPSGTAHLGAKFGENNSAGPSARRAISADGTRVFWEAEGALYVRDTQLHKTLQLDAAEPGCGECESGGGRFQIASSDGTRVLFTDNRPLTADSGIYVAASGPGPRDLYECLIVVGEAGNLSCGPHGPTDLTPLTGGESAGVRGDILGAGENGETLYFVAAGTLGTTANLRGESAVAGQPNLYVRRGGETRFIAVLAEGDLYDWGESAKSITVRVSLNGQWLSFMSERSLTGYDNHDAVSGHPDAEIYLYDAETGRTSCASCNPTGARPVGVEYHQVSGTGGESLVGGDVVWNPTGWVAALLPIRTAYTQSASLYQSRYLSNSGRLFFNSLDALVPQDVNGNWDVYEYEPSGYVSPEGRQPCASDTTTFSEASAGCTSLISSGTSPQQSAFLDASETGGDVFFLTSTKLTTQDIDANFDVYDAHECTSASPCIPPPAVSPPACSTEASCKAAPSPPPSIFGAPPSATFSGRGNLEPAPATLVKKRTAAQLKAEKLAKALRACRKDRQKAKRTKCEKQAKQKYGARPIKQASNRRRTK